MMGRPQVIQALLIALLASAHAYGAEDGKVSLQGYVLDPQNAAVPGAAVELHKIDGSLAASAFSDDSGHYLISAADCVRCSFVVRHAGFATLSRPVPGKGAIDVHLELEKVATSLDVSGESSTAVSAETTENRNTTELGQSDLRSLPILDQDYITFLQQFLDSGALATSGVSLVVNGVEANGPGVTPSAIQHVKINNNPYSALFARPGRARLEITTEGGTPRYHGSINASLRNSVFDATPAFTLSKPKEQKRYLEGSLTGPIVNLHKTTFLLSAQYDTTDDFAAVNAVLPTGTFYANVPQPQKHAFLSGRVFHDYGKGNQFWIGYSYEVRDQKNMFVGGIVLPEAGMHEHFQEHEVNMQNTTVISPKWVNQLRLLVGHFDDPVTDNTIATKLRVLGAFTGGGAQGTAKRTEYHVDGNDIATYSSGKHEVKFGVDVPDISRRGEDDFTNRLGTFTYASLSDYQAGHPQLLQVNQGVGHLVFLEATFAGLVEDTYRVTPNFTMTTGARWYYQNFFHNDPNNIAPRFGFAYRPGTQSKTVIRGGSGVFYDRSGPRAIADLLRYDNGRMRQYLIVAPATMNPIAATANEPFSMTRLSPGARIPYVVQWSLGAERQVLGASVLSVEYASTRGIKQFRTLDLNAPLPGTLMRPNGAFGQLRTYDTEGRSATDSVELNFRGNITKRFSGQMNYRAAWAKSNTDGITYIPSESYAPNADWSWATWDQRHRFYILGTSLLPYKFKLGTAFQATSGQPYNMTTGYDNNGDAVLNDRPNGVPRNSLRMAGYVNLDLKLGREFQLTKKAEGMVLSASLMSTNVLNHINYKNYIGVETSPYFMHPIGANPPRRVQASLSFRF